MIVITSLIFCQSPISCLYFILLFITAQAILKMMNQHILLSTSLMFILFVYESQKRPLLCPMLTHLGSLWYQG